MMRHSAIAQKKRKDMILRSKRMTPEQRLAAFLEHAELMAQLYQAGVRYRAGCTRKLR